MKQYLVLVLVFILLVILVSCDLQRYREEIIHQRGGLIEREFYREYLSD